LERGTGARHKVAGRIVRDGLWLADLPGMLSQEGRGHRVAKLSSIGVEEIEGHNLANQTCIWHANLWHFSWHAAALSSVDAIAGGADIFQQPPTRPGCARATTHHILLICLPACLPTCLLALLFARLHTRLPACLPARPLAQAIGTNVRSRTEAKPAALEAGGRTHGRITVGHGEW